MLNQIRASSGIPPRVTLSETWYYPIGSFHIDIAEVRTKEGRLYLFVAIHRTSKFAFVELRPRPGSRPTSCQP
jgi:hypothetical protein